MAEAKLRHNVCTTREKEHMPQKAFHLGGVNPALVTPFKGDQSVDENAFRVLIRHVIENVDGLVPCGTTGEFNYLTPDENRRLVEIAVDESQGKPVIAGTGAAATKSAIRLAKDAQAAGASACLVVTPFFLHPSDKGVYQHYYELAKAVPDLPVILYNIPQVVDAYLPRRVVEDLADIPNVVGLKDSSGNLTYTMEILEYVGDRINIVVGHDEVVLNALAGGASGMILASAQVYPKVWQAIFQAVRSGDLETARKLQRSVQKLSRIFCRHGGGVAVKQALKMLGVPAGRPRGPLKSVGGALLHEDRAEIQLELERLGSIQGPEAEHNAPVGSLETRFLDVGMDPNTILEFRLRTGTGRSGEGVEAAQIDLLCGSKSSPLAEAWAYQLTYPRHGFEALTTILEPNLTVRPSTLIVPTNELRDLRQANMVYGPVQNAVAQAIVDKLAQELIPESAMSSELFLILAAIHPQALDRRRLHRAAYEATCHAIDGAFSRGA
jgi:4-hydroxy-tetrahydrodipicolinate synthase